MKKTILFLLIFVALLVCAVGYSDSAYRTAIGRKAPVLAVTKADSLMRLDRLQGNYVLLTFWSGADAPSRQAVNRYTAWSRQHPESHLKMVNINFDTSKSLYEDLVRRDGLIPADNFHAAGLEAKAIKDNYGLADGYGTLLVDPSGKIVAHNPEPAALAGLIKGVAGTPGK